jgi:hypothetical protein
MTASTTPLNAAETNKGTRLAPALNQKLAGSEPLLDVADWYVAQFHTVLTSDERLGFEGHPDSSDIETAAVAVHYTAGKADLCVRCSRHQGDVCVCFAMLEDARAALRSSDSVN